MTPTISATELAPLLGDPRAVILDARVGPDAEARFAAGHLPGAHFVRVEGDLSLPRDPRHGGRHPLPPLDGWCESLGRWGVTPERRVVVVDEASGGNAAARAWWMLRAVGHEGAQVLDGGLASARAAGLPFTAAPTPIVPGPPWRAGGWGLPTVDADGAAAAPVRIDARSRPRWAGLIEPFDPVAGRIPGAVNVPWEDLLDGGRLREPAALRAIFAPALSAPGARGAHPAEVVVYCGSGVTACLNVLAMEVAGLGTASLYVGSWGEWCRSGRPREP